MVILEHIPKEQSITGQVLTKYDDEGRFRVITHVTLYIHQRRRNPRHCSND